MNNSNSFNNNLAETQSQWSLCSSTSHWKINGSARKNCNSFYHHKCRSEKRGKKGNFSTNEQITINTVTHTKGHMSESLRELRSTTHHKQTKTPDLLKLLLTQCLLYVRATCPYHLPVPISSLYTTYYIVWRKMKKIRIMMIITKIPSKVNSLNSTILVLNVSKINSGFIYLHDRVDKNQLR